VTRKKEDHPPLPESESGRAHRQPPVAGKPNTGCPQMREKIVAVMGGEKADH
jgi:hypothetical protein